MAVLEPYRGGYFLWKYLPSVEAAAIFCVLWVLATFAYVWKIWKTRLWFGAPFAVGCFSLWPCPSTPQTSFTNRGMPTVEFVGYAARASAHTKTGKLMPFAIQNSMILLAPVLFAASIYMTLGRVVRAIKGEKHSVIRPGWLTKLFVTGDILSLAIQGSAAGLMIIRDIAKIGQGLVIAGLVFQIIIFGLFCLTAIQFHRRMRRDAAAAYVPVEVKWEQTLQMLYGVSALVMERSIFRVVEFIMGNDGYLLSTEWPVYVFDAVPMLLAMGIFWQWWPSFGSSTEQEESSWGATRTTSDISLRGLTSNKGEPMP